MATITMATTTMAKAIERYFNVALYLLVLTGFGALASTGGLDLPAVVGVGMALALRGYQLLTRREFAIPERWTNVLTHRSCRIARRLMRCGRTCFRISCQCSLL